MSDLVKEWIEKAEGDYITALREYRARKSPNYDASVFHAQQCIEKYMKAFLQKQEIAFGKVHDLIALMELDPENFSFLQFYREYLAYLNQFAVAYRYPGDTATKDQAKKAIQMMKILRAVLRKMLGQK